MVQSTTFLSARMQHGVRLQLRLLRPLHPAGQQTVDTGSGGGSGTSGLVAAESETVEKEEEELVQLQPMHA